mmetsp:Transcript_48950/g.151522  ORF Transcript_48950/g.151522 Transcript_48950/m.151522 type:complete len:414 (-) Transcript_48950:98-1339(-)
MKAYELPKPLARLTLLSNMVEMVDAFFGQNLTAMTDEDMFKSMIDRPRIQNMLRQYAEQKDAPSVAKMVDAFFASLGDQPWSREVASHAFDDMQQSLHGVPLYDVLVYLKTSMGNSTLWDPATFFELAAPVLAQFKAPPSVPEYLRGWADVVRSKEPVNRERELNRLASTLVEAARQLELPPSLPSLFMISIEGTPERDEQKVDQLFRFCGTAEELNEALDGPPALGTLFREILNVALTEKRFVSVAEMMHYLSQAMVQLGEPQAIADLLEYVVPMILGKSPPIKGRFLELTAQLADQVEAPEAIGQFAENLATMEKRGDKIDGSQVLQMVIQMTRRAGMPGIAEILDNVVEPMIKGKVLDPSVFASVLPRILGLKADLKSGKVIAENARLKLMEPFLKFQGHLASKLRFRMP